jgi:hypothetical protein
MGVTTLPPLDKNLPRNLYEYLQKMGASLDNSTVQLAAISRGEAPFGGGDPLAGVTDHGLLTGLTPDDDHDQYLLLRGRVGGQTANGSIDLSTTSSLSMSDAALNFVQANQSGTASTFNATALASAAINNAIILIMSTNGVSLSDGSTNYHTDVTDSQGNTWTKLGEFTKTYFAATICPTVSIWFCLVTTAMTIGVDTITATFSTNLGCAACESRQFASVAGATPTVVASATDGLQDSDVAASLSISGLSSNSYLYIRGTSHYFSSFAVAGVYTPTTGHTAFVSNHTNSTIASGGGGFAMASRGEFLIETGTGDTTQPEFQPASFNDDASLMIALSLGTPAVGDLILQSINNTNAAKIHLQNSTIYAYSDFFNFRAQGGLTTLSYIRGTDGAFIGPVYPTAFDVPDSVFRITGSSDATKKVAFEVDGLTTATTRTLTVPDVSGTIVVETGGGATTPQLDHSDLSNLSADDHTQYLRLAGRTGGQIIGNGTHSGATQATDVAIEGQLLIDHADANTSFSSSAFDIRYNPPANGTCVNISITYSNSVTNGIGTGLDLVANGTMSAGGTSSVLRGFRFINTGTVGTGATVTTSLGGLFQTTMATSGGTLNRALGLQVISSGDTNATTMSLGVQGLEVQVNPRGATMTNLRWLSLIAASGTASGSVTNLYGIDFGAGVTPLDVAAVTNYTCIRLPDAPTNPGGTIRGLAVGTIKSHHVGQFRFGDTTTPTHSIEIAAGTTTRAPLLLTSGTSLTSPVAGAIEFNTDDFFATITTGPARKAFILDDGTRLTSGRVPFATTNGRLTDDADFTFATDTLTVTKIAAHELTGNLTIADAINIILNTGTGTKIGTGTNQKLSFWNAPPVIQPTTAIAAATFAANTSGIADDSATWDSYTIGQIVAALRQVGILA